MEKEKNNNITIEEFEKYKNEILDHEVIMVNFYNKRAQMRMDKIKNVVNNYFDGELPKDILNAFEENAVAETEEELILKESTIN